MPDINMQVFEEAQRNQLVTEVDIQTQVALNDYQVQLSDIANPTQSQDNVVIDRFGEFLPHWNESLDFDTWIKVNMEIAGKQILILRGNLSVSSESSGNDTFIQWHGAATANFLDSLDITLPFIYQAKAKLISSNDVYFGVSNQQLAYLDDVAAIRYRATSTGTVIVRNEGAADWESFPAISTGVWYYPKIVAISSSSVKMYPIDATEYELTTNIPDESMGLLFYEYAGSGEQEWSFIRQHTAIEPTWVTNSTPKNIAIVFKSLGRAG